MAQSGDTEGDAGPPPSDGLALIGETKSFLKRWQRILLGQEPWDAEQVAALRQQSRDLEARARAAGVPGLGQHLQGCEQCFWNGEVDREKLAFCLRNVSEVAWLWRHDLRRRSELGALDGEGHVPRERLTIDAPTLLTPPSIELFESSPSPEPENWLAPSLAPWSRPSLASRLWRALGGRGAGGARRPKPAQGPLAFPTLAGAPVEPPSAEEAPLSETDPSFTARSETDPAFAARSETEASFAAPSALRPVGERRAAPLWSASIGLIGIAGVGALAWAFGGPGEQPTGAPVVSGRAGAAPAAAGGGALGGAEVRRLLAAAHRRGGLESPELAALLDEEGAALSSTGVCTPGSVGCRLVSASHGLTASSASASGSTSEARAGWLVGLDPPVIGLSDEARVGQLFELHTRSAVGREAFQELLFRCAPYRRTILAALDRYELSHDLLALPMAASGCLPDAESGDGGRGLWQLSPAAAKGYRLRFRPQLVDERLDPFKSTDAAVRLIEDLRRKTGSWALAIAAHRVGPLALLTLLGEAGEDPDYAALAHGGLLPKEALEFVAKVQAFALILGNIEKFGFEPVRTRAPEGTATVEVPPGTRLGLVARAAASSTTKIRELNPDVLGDRVPDLPGEKFLLRVPKESGLRAREVLPDLIASSDHADECVPHAFDWGRQRFTSAMASRCEQGLTSSP